MWIVEVWDIDLGRTTIEERGRCRQGRQSAQLVEIKVLDFFVLPNWTYSWISCHFLTYHKRDEL